MAALFLSLCLLLVTECFGQDCGLINQQERVLDGAPALPCTVPWHVQVHFVPDNTDFSLSADTMTCSGTIIDTDYVMVSPTCLFLYATNISQILKRAVLSAGDNDVDVYPETNLTGRVQEQFRVPEAVFFQDEYTIRSQLDLVSRINPSAGDLRAYRDYQCAILKVKDSFVFDACVNKICLPEAGDSNCPHKNCRFSGNGYITRDRNAPQRKSSRLQVTYMTQLSRSACGILEEMTYALPMSGGFCAKTENVGAPCVDDNGGALACIRNGRYFLMGNSVPDFCTSQAAAMFSDVSQCLGFVTRTLAGQSTPAV